jgi:hypothetical protein
MRIVRYGENLVSEAKRLKEMDEENARVKKLVTDLSNEDQILKKVAKEASKPGHEEPGSGLCV